MTVGKALNFRTKSGGMHLFEVEVRPGDRMVATVSREGRGKRWRGALLLDREDDPWAAVAVEGLMTQADSPEFPREAADRVAKTIIHGAVVSATRLISSRVYGLLDLWRFGDVEDELENLNGHRLPQYVQRPLLARDQMAWERMVMTFFAAERGIISWAVLQGNIPKNPPHSIRALLREFENPRYEAYDVFESRSLDDILILQDAMLQMGIESAALIAVPPELKERRFWVGRRGMHGWDAYLLRPTVARSRTRPKGNPKKKRSKKQLASILRKALR